VRRSHHGDNVAGSTTKQSDADALTDFGRRTLPIVHALHAAVNSGLASPRHDYRTIPICYRTIPTDAPRPIVYALPHHTGVLIKPRHHVVDTSADTSRRCWSLSVPQ